MSTRVVVTGTDTDIGKTVFAAALSRRSTAITGSRCKPASTARRTRKIVRRLSGLKAVAHFARGLPAADGRLAARCRRARRHSRSIPERSAAAQLPTAAGDRSGGWADGAADSRACCRSSSSRGGKRRSFSVLRPRLGTINHTLLSIEALKRRAHSDARRRLHRRRERRYRTHDRGLRRRSSSWAGCRCSIRSTARRCATLSRRTSGSGHSRAWSQRPMRSPVWHPFTQHGLEPQMLRHRRGRGRLARSERRATHIRWHLVVVGHHARSSSSADRARHPRAGRQAGPGDLRRLHARAGRNPGARTYRDRPAAGSRTFSFPTADRRRSKSH